MMNENPIAEGNEHIITWNKIEPKEKFVNIAISYREIQTDKEQNRHHLNKLFSR